MKTKSKLNAYILRGSAAALLVSCVIVGLCSAIDLREPPAGLTEEVVIQTDESRGGRRSRPRLLDPSEEGVGTGGHGQALGESGPGLTTEGIADRLVGLAEPGGGARVRLGEAWEPLGEDDAAFADRLRKDDDELFASVARNDVDLADRVLDRGLVEGRLSLRCRVHARGSFFAITRLQVTVEE